MALADHMPMPRSERLPASCPYPTRGRDRELSFSTLATTSTKQPGPARSSAEGPRSPRDEVPRCGTTACAEASRAARDPVIAAASAHGRPPGIGTGAGAGVGEEPPFGQLDEHEVTGDHADEGQQEA